jgi:hypothetical protein
MEMLVKIWKVIGFGAMALILFVATLIIIRWVIGFVTWSTLDSGWTQAIGSIIALAASFGFFYAQKRAEVVRIETESILTMTKSVIAVLHVSKWTIDAMETALEQMECQHVSGIIPFSTDQFDELRAAFSQFVDPMADFTTLLHALKFSTFLSEAKVDFFAVQDEQLRDYIIDRSLERVNQAKELIVLLSEHESELLDECSKRGVNPIAGPLKSPPVRAHETG